MSDESQIVVPPSFIALFVAPGRTRPGASREFIVERHELCEDLATLLTDTARTRLWDLGITEADVLQRIGRGLPGSELGLSIGEQRWVLTRLAEMLGWDLPRFETASG
jgi:hypothetical protein